MSEEQSPSESSVAPNTVYDACPACIPRYKHLRRSIRPLPVSAGIAPGPDGVDWNDYYWGYTDANRHERRTIIRPLPLHITNRVPQELIEHVIDFLRWETRDLYNCALVCRAWHHHSLVLLYEYVHIRGRAAYREVMQVALQNRQSQHWACTRTLRLSDDDNPSRGESYVQAAPLTLAGLMPNLQCLEFGSCMFPPYQRHFVVFMSRFTQLVHLSLRHFCFYSFGDLRRIICSLPKLAELNLSGGVLTSGTSTPLIASSGFVRKSAPRLSKLYLTWQSPKLLSCLASWIRSTDECKYVTWLNMEATDHSDSIVAAGSILQALGPSLTDLCVWPEFEVERNALGQCTSLVIAQLFVRVHITEFWRGVITALHTAISPLSSTKLVTLRVAVYQKYGSVAPAGLDVFRDIDIGTIHGIISEPRFASLRSVTVSMAWHHGGGPVSDTAEETDTRVRLILEPWDKRRILVVKYNDHSTSDDFALQIAASKQITRVDSDVKLESVGSQDGGSDIDSK